jgi:hypothetical protein
MTGGRVACYSIAVVALYLNRFFRTFGANKKQKSPAINNLHDLSNHTFTLFPKSIQVVDWDRLVHSFLFEAAPKMRKIRFKGSATSAYAFRGTRGLVALRRRAFEEILRAWCEENGIEIKAP